MIKPLNIVSVWTHQLEKGEQPNGDELIDHLTAIHDNNAGFTETVAWNCRDLMGKNSYELLADIIDTDNHSKALDLACGSGVLLDLCNRRFGNKISLVGVDMNNAELQLARKRLIDTNIKLHYGIAQDLSFIDDSSVDVILCHWALSLMDPVEPVLKNIKRILRKNGSFGAIIEGDFKTAPTYLEINNIIYKHVRKEYPNYGVIELGDMSMKTFDALKENASKIFDNVSVDVTPFILSFSASAEILAREVAGFFYASFVLSENGYNKMLLELEKYFSENFKSGLSSFEMPVKRVVIN